MINNIKTISRHDGKHVSAVGDTYRIIISGKESQGDYAIIDMLIPPGGGPPPHTHASCVISIQSINFRRKTTTLFIVEVRNVITWFLFLLLPISQRYGMTARGF